MAINLLTSKCMTCTVSITQLWTFGVYEGTFLSACLAFLLFGVSIHMSGTEFIKVRYDNVSFMEVS